MFLLTLALLATPADPSVTYSTRGASVGRIVGELRQKTGVTVECDAFVGSEIVLVDVKDVKLSDLLGQIAKVSAGEVKDNGSYYRLTRSESQRRKSREREVRESAERFAKEIETRKKELAPFTSATSDQLAGQVQATLKGRKAANDSNYFRAMQGHDQKSPAGRLAVRALAAFGPKTLAELRPEDRIVYSTRPTPMQRPIPFDLSPILNQYRQEQTLYAKSLQTRIDAKQMEGWSSGSVQPSVPPPPSKVLLSLERQPYVGGIQLGLVMVDGENRISQQINVEIDAPGAERLQPPSTPADPNDPLIPFSETSQQYLQVAKAMMTGGAPKLPPALEKELVEPEKFDPISFVLPDGIRAVAEGRNVVAQLEDMAFMSVTMLADAKGQIAKNRFAKWLSAGHDLERSKDWLVITPTQPWDARETRINRGLLGRFYRQTRESGVDLDSVATYVKEAPRRYIETVSFIYSFLLQPQVNSAIEMDNIDFLRAYGELPPQMRKSVRDGASYNFSQLPLGARNELSHLAFRANAPLQFSFSGPEVNEGNRTLAQEPTEGMPNGVPATAQLTGQLTAEPGVIGKVEAGGSGAYAFRPMRPWDLAWAIASDDGKAHPNDLVRYSKYKYGQMGTLRMAIQYTPTLGAEKNLILSDFPNHTPWVDYAQLPAEFRAAVEKHLPEAKEKVSEMRKRETDAKVPPPL